MIYESLFHSLKTILISEGKLFVSFIFAFLPLLLNTEELGAFIQMRAGLVLLFNRCVLAMYDFAHKQMTTL